MNKFRCWIMCRDCETWRQIESKDVFISSIWLILREDNFSEGILFFVATENFTSLDTCPFNFGTSLTCDTSVRKLFPYLVQNNLFIETVLYVFDCLFVSTMNGIVCRAYICPILSSKPRQASKHVVNQNSSWLLHVLNNIVSLKINTVQELLQLKRQYLNKIHF